MLVLGIPIQIGRMSHRITTRIWRHGVILDFTYALRSSNNRIVELTDWLIKKTEHLAQWRILLNANCKIKNSKQLLHFNNGKYQFSCVYTPCNELKTLYQPKTESLMKLLQFQMGKVLKILISQLVVCWDVHIGVNVSKSIIVWNAKLHQITSQSAAPFSRAHKQ